MSVAAKKKVYRYTPPTGKKLAQLIYDRCKRNVERYARSHAGVSIQFEPLADRVAMRGTMEIYASGHSKQDERDYEKALRVYYSDPVNARIAGDVEWIIKDDLKSKGVLPMPGGENAGQFGWELDVEMFVVPPGTFDVKVNAWGKVPPEIIRCLESTYNEFIDEFGMEDE